LDNFCAKRIGAVGTAASIDSVETIGLIESIETTASKETIETFFLTFAPYLEKL